MSKYDALWRYVSGREEETLKLTFAQIEQIAGVPIDHSFLRYNTNNHLNSGNLCRNPAPLSSSKKLERFLRSR